MFGGPGGDLPVGVRLEPDQGAPGVAGPEERTSGDGLIRSGHLDGVVGQGGTEVAAPSRFAVVAVGAGVGEHVRPVVAHLDPERVGVAVGRDRQVPVGTCIAAAPDLVAVGRRAPQQRQAGVRVVARTAVGVDGGRRRPSMPRASSSPSVRRSATTCGVSNRDFTDCKEPRPPLGRRGIEDQSPSVVPIPVAGRAERHVHRRRDHVEHAGEEGPKVVGQGTSGPLRFHGGHDSPVRARSRGSRRPSRG